jgi:hypothetical protein
MYQVFQDESFLIAKEQLDKTEPICSPTYEASDSRKWSTFFFLKD